MSFSQITNNIRRREKPNDVHITPLALAKKHIKIVNGYCSRTVWLKVSGDDERSYKMR